MCEVPVGRFPTFLPQKGRECLVIETWCHPDLTGLPKAKELQIVPNCSVHGCCNETTKSGKRRSHLLDDVD